MGENSLTQFVPTGPKHNGHSLSPREWRGGERFLVPVTEPDLAHLDSLADRCREALAAGRPLEPILEDWVRSREAEIVREAVRRVLMQFGRLRHDPAALRQKFLVYLHAFDLAATYDLNGSDIARLCHVSKQAIQTDAKNVREDMGQPLQLANMRPLSARARMAARNHRHGRKTPVLDLKSLV